MTTRCAISISACFRTRVKYVRAQRVDDSRGAIRTLAVRGAPCIGVFGAYGVALLRSRNLR